MLIFSDEDKKIAPKSYHENLLPAEFEWDRNIVLVIYSQPCATIDKQGHG